MKLYNKLQGVRNIDNKVIVVYNYSLVDDGKFLLNFTVDGIAKCAPEDKFEFIKGRRLAESRAHLKALKKTRNFLKDKSKKMLDESTRIAQIFERFNYACNREINHVDNLCNQ